jgi:starvation-inducible DNA-binding protein
VAAGTLEPGWTTIERSAGAPFADLIAGRYPAPKEGGAMAKATQTDPFRTKDGGSGVSSQPLFHQHGEEVQEFGKMRLLPIALGYEARVESCQLLNQILSDSMILYAMYKKHHWLVRGPTFFQLHLLLDKHADEQLKLIDLLGERVQTLGGVAVGDPRLAAEITTIPRPPDGAEEVPAMLSRLLEAHEIIIQKAREAITKTAESRDDGTNDLLMSDVLRTNELQVWFVAEHLVDVPVVRV